MSNPGLHGTPFGEWLLLDKLGSGSSDVWRAWSESYGEVALKIMTGASLAYAYDPNAPRRFTKEYETLLQMNHPGIVQVFDFGLTHGSLWFAMRLIEGQSLNYWIQQFRAREQAMPRWFACNIVRQIAFALEHAHSKQVIHRDVKPHNILVDANNKAYLADFGIAKLIDSKDHMTRTGRIFGTVPYMSPEQCSGGQQIGPATDIYSLACVLYQCLNPLGDPPFLGNNDQGIMFQHVHRPPRLLSNDQVNDALMNIILTALEKRPENRYDSASAFGRALSPFV